MKRSARPTRVAIAAVAMSLLVAACGGDTSEDTSTTAGSDATTTSDAAATTTTSGDATSTTDGGTATEDLVIGYAGLSSQFPFVADVNQGLEEAAAEAGVELIVLDNEFDPQVALTNADLLIQQGANVIIEFQTDVGVAGALCEKFDAAGLGDKVIAIDIPHEPCAAFYGANNPLAGEIAGEQLALAAQELWGEVSKLVLLALPQSGELVVSRTDGYITGVQKVFPDFSEEDVIEVDGGGGLEPALAVMQDVLATLGDETHILVGAVADPTAVGALRAIQSAGRAEDFLIGGQNATIEARVEICNNSPTFIGSVGYFPELYGFDLVDLAVTLHEGGTIEPFNFIEHLWVDNSNIRDFYPNC